MIYYPAYICHIILLNIRLCSYDDSYATGEGEFRQWIASFRQMPITRLGSVKMELTNEKKKRWLSHHHTRNLERTGSDFVGISVCENVEIRESLQRFCTKIYPLVIWASSRVNLKMNFLLHNWKISILKRAHSCYAREWNRLMFQRLKLNVQINRTIQS